MSLELRLTLLIDKVVMAFFISFCNANLECSDDPLADRSLCNPDAKSRSHGRPAGRRGHAEKLKALEWKMKKVLRFHPPSLWRLTQQSLSVWKRLIIFILLHVITRKTVSRIKMLLAILMSHKQTGTQCTLPIYQSICISSALEAGIRACPVGPWAQQDKMYWARTDISTRETSAQLPPWPSLPPKVSAPKYLAEVAACQLWMGQHPFNVSSHHHQIDCLMHNKVTWRQHILTENI